MLKLNTVRKNVEALSNIDLNNYTFEFTPTDSTKEGSLIYIEKDLRYKTRNDLNLFREKEIESKIIEANLRNKNKINSCI